MNSVIGAGNLSLIQDAELRQLIARWPGEVANFKSIEDGYAEVARNYLVPFIVERADLPPFWSEMWSWSRVNSPTVTIPPC